MIMESIFTNVLRKTYSLITSLIFIYDNRYSIQSKQTKLVFQSSRQRQASFSRQHWKVHFKSYFQEIVKDFLYEEVLENS